MQNQSPSGFLAKFDMKALSHIRCVSPRPRFSSGTTAFTTTRLPPITTEQAQNHLMNSIKTIETLFVYSVCCEWRKICLLCVDKYSVFRNHPLPAGWAACTTDRLVGCVSTLELYKSSREQRPGRRLIYTRHTSPPLSQTRSLTPHTR